MIATAKATVLRPSLGEWAGAERVDADIVRGSGYEECFCHCTVSRSRPSILDTAVVCINPGPGIDRRGREVR
jgi:hypothetical protein